MMESSGSKNGALLTLTELAKARAPSRDQVSKADHYYDTYARFFDPIRSKPLTVFEIGVHKGESTKVFSEYFENSTIIGLDFMLRNIDLTGFDNIHLYQGDQSDKARLHELVAKHAPDGIDIVIEDAAHEGALSLATFRILFPKLKSGGLYMIEDWGTGYWPNRNDGHEFIPVKQEGTRIISHDYGMIGFVKHLMDFVAGSGVASGAKPEPVLAMHILPGIVVLEKR